MSDKAKMQERFVEVKGEIAAKCAHDSDFRAALIRDPGATIEEEYGLEKGAMSEFTFNVMLEDDKTIVIPIPPDMTEAELSDDELDQVAGGFAFTAGLTIATVGLAAAVMGGSVAAGAVVQGTRAGRQW
jgi:hypothetical protein